MTGADIATTRLARLLALVPWVAGHSEGVPVDEVCARFDVSVEELARDLDTVMMVGVHPFTPDTMIEAWLEEDMVLIRYADAFARPLRLTSDEAVALIAAARGLAAVPGVNPDGPLQRAVDKVASVVGTDAGVDLVVDLGAAPEDVFAALETARSTARQITIEYPDDDTDSTRSRRIEPQRVFSMDGNWYVSGWCHHARDNRVFRVDRILAVAPTDEPFDHPDSDAPASVSIDPSLPQVTIEVQRAAAWLLEGVPVVARDDRDGVVRVRLAVGSERWLGRLLVQLGEAARVIDHDPALDPGTLARAEAERIRRRYTSS